MGSRNIFLARKLVWLTGVLYVLIAIIGLHQYDNDHFLLTLRLRDLGNTVLVVEHDEAILLADYVVDMGQCWRSWQHYYGRWHRQNYGRQPVAD